MVPCRVWAISDVHIDYQENFNILTDFARRGHRLDALIIAGDVTDRLDRLQQLLEIVVPCFHRVLYVPGNHELWIRRSDYTDSLQKFDAIMELCRYHGVQTEPVKIGQYRQVWLVPLYSWYDDKPCVDHTLYMDKHTEDHTDQMWGDFFHTRWPESMTLPIAAHFASLNEPFLAWNFDAPIISFSHFLPRQELIFNRQYTEAELANIVKMYDPHPDFNFSRVAGSTRILQQIQQLGSKVHVYGHQHRNRVRVLDGVTYISHCMGYPKERSLGYVKADAMTPRCIWREDTGFCQ